MGISVPESLPAFGHQTHIDIGRCYMAYKVGELEMLEILEIVEVMGVVGVMVKIGRMGIMVKTERKGTMHRMQRLSVIVAKKSSRKLLKSESSGSTVTIVPHTWNYSYGMRRYVMEKEEKKKTMKIMVFTEDACVVLTYRLAPRGLLILKGGSIKPLPPNQSSGRSYDPMFEIPLVWGGTIQSLMDWIQRSAYVTTVALTDR